MFGSFLITPFLLILNYFSERRDICKISELENWSQWFILVGSRQHLGSEQIGNCRSHLRLPCTTTSISHRYPLCGLWTLTLNINFFVSSQSYIDGSCDRHPLQLENPAISFRTLVPYKTRIFSLGGSCCVDVWQCPLHSTVSGSLLFADRAHQKSYYQHSLSRHEHFLQLYDWIIAHAHVQF